MLEANKETIKGLTKEGTVLVDFYATWCGPCKMLASQFQMASDMMDNVTFVKADIEQLTEKQLEDYGCMAVPTLILLKDGEKIGHANGFMPKEAIIEFVQEKL